MFNKELLKKRIEQMFWLPQDWDGFGTIPITKKAHDVGVQMIDYVEIEVDCKVLVGVDPEGSLYWEFYRPPSRIEMTIMPDGSIEYVEVREDKVLTQGGFHLSYGSINELLGQKHD